MRAVALLLVMLTLFLGPAWAEPVQESQHHGHEAAETEAPEGSELFAPGRPLADQPLRGLRLEPPERLSHEAAPADFDAEMPRFSAAAPLARRASLRPWTETLALHVEICVFLC